MSSYTYSSKDIKYMRAVVLGDRDFYNYFNSPLSSLKDVVDLINNKNCEEFEDYGYTIEKFLNLYTAYLRRKFEFQLSFSTVDFLEKFEVEICDIEDDDGVGSIVDTKKNWFFYNWKDAERKFNEIVETLDVVGTNNIGVYINVYLYDKETLFPKGVNPNGTCAATEYLAGLKL